MRWQGQLACVLFQAQDLQGARSAVSRTSITGCSEKATRMNTDRKYRGQSKSAWGVRCTKKPPGEIAYHRRRKMPPGANLAARVERGWGYLDLDEVGALTVIT